jgi:hypothetical protein
LKTNFKHVILRKNNNTRLFSTKFKSLILYNDSEFNKYKALKENKDKSGVYRWVNKLNNESYIGSSVNLIRRLSQYYSIKDCSAKNRISSKIVV